LLPADIALWPDELPAELACWPPYFDLRIRRRGGASVVVSSGVVDDVAEWSLLPNHSVSALPLDGGPLRTTALDDRASRRATSAAAAR
jgi:hypothetical protein